MNDELKVDVTYCRNVANAGRGSAMTETIHQLCDALQAERERAEKAEAAQTDKAERGVA